MPDSVDIPAPVKAETSLESLRSCTACPILSSNEFIGVI
jgi:hypothetical protein